MIKIGLFAGAYHEEIESQMTLIGGMNTDWIAALRWQWMNHEGTNNTKQHEGVR